MEKHVFQVVDYVVFVGCLALSLAIGIFYAFSGGRQKTTKEFLMANRNMSFGPTSLSLLVTIMSAITVLGVPAVIYQFGTGYWMFAFSYFVFIPIAAHCIIPVFHDMKVTSVYEYLDRRFSHSVRTCGTVSYIFMMVVYMGVVIYAPALAINAVTQLDVWLTVCILCLICTLYTALGGLKAVIWTDVFQAVVMLVSQLVIIGIGCNNVGGVWKVWEVAIDAGKITPINFSPNPLIPHTFWSTCIGGTFLCLSIYCINQAAAQRFLCCKTKTQAKISIYLNLPLLQVVMVIGCFLGLLMYAEYRCSNPLASGAKPDQLLLYYVMYVLGDYPGLPGLIIACIFCASLSTVSSCFNSLATVTLQDIIRPNFQISDKLAAKISKLFVVCYAVLSLAMAGIASQMDSILKSALSILGIIGGPVLSLFLLGLFSRRANHIGALSGFFISMLIVTWIGFGSIFYRINNPRKTTPALFLDESCNVTYTTSPVTAWPTNFQNYTTSMPGESIVPELYTGVHAIYKLSYMWYSGLSCIISCTIATIVSYLTEVPQIDEETLHPWIRSGAKLGPKKKQDKNSKEESDKLTINQNTV